MIVFKDPSKYEHIKEIKNILSNKAFFSLLELGNFKEVYDLLLKSDIQSKVMGEFTKFLYSALKIDPLSALSEVPDFFLPFTDLIQIKIPSHITAINDYSFAILNNLKEVILPPNLEVLGVSCFLSCPELKEITIPKSLKEIKHRAFQNCPKLNKTYYEGTFEDFLKIKRNVNFADHKKIKCADTTIAFSYTKGKWIDLNNDIYVP